MKNEGAMWKPGKKVWRMAWYDFLQDHPLCQECEKRGIKELATKPHHPKMESVKGRYLDLKNCIPLCDKHYREARRKSRKERIRKKLQGSVSSGE